MAINLNPSIDYVSRVMRKPLRRDEDDAGENAAVKRARQLFGSEHANVRSDSAEQADNAVFTANLEPGDTALGVNFSSKSHFNFIEYDIEEGSGRINYENVFGLAFKHKPKLIVVGTCAYPRKMDFVQLQEAAEEVGARLMVDMSHIAGLVAAGLHPSPVPHADFVTTTTAGTLGGPMGGIIMCRGKYAGIIDKAVSDNSKGESPMTPAAVEAALQEALSPEFKTYQKQTVENARALAAGLTKYNFTLVTGGTDNHVVVVDLRNKGLTGQEAEKILEQAGLRVAKSYLPGVGSTGIAGGIRMSTPAVTGSGMKEEAMGRIAEIINMVIALPQDEISLANAKRLVAELCRRHRLGQAELEV